MDKVLAKSLGMASETNETNVQGFFLFHGAIQEASQRIQTDFLQIPRRK